MYISERSLCNTIDVKVRTPIEKKSDYSKDSFYVEFYKICSHFPNYHIKIVRRYCKIGERIFSN